MQTPLGNKGKVPAAVKQKLEQKGKWMCLTCLYCENEEGSPECAMCGAPNPKHKSSVVLQECWNCGHRNDEFAQDCRMCGKALSGGAAAAAAKRRAENMMDDSVAALQTGGFRDAEDSPRAGW